MLLRAWQERRAPRPASVAWGAAALDLAQCFDYIGRVETDDALAALTGLAQETRLRLFRRLVEQGPEGMSPGAIAGELRLADATLSFHLKELARAGLVSARRAGRFIYYNANYRTMNGLVAYLTQNCCRGASCDIACAPVRKPKGRAS
jgi:ArsR family transcriptional regulator